MTQALVDEYCRRGNLAARLADLEGRQLQTPAVERDYSALQRELQSEQNKYAEVRQAAETVRDSALAAIAGLAVTRLSSRARWVPVALVLVLVAELGVKTADEPETSTRAPSSPRYWTRL